LADATDVLLALYQDAVGHGRHHEDQRALMTNLLVVICAGLLGVVGFDDRISRADLPFSVFVIVLGVFGALFSAKHHERFDLHQERGKGFRKALEALHPETHVSSLRATAATKVKEEHPYLYRVRLFWFWLAVPLIVAVTGAIVTVLAILGH